MRLSQFKQQLDEDEVLFLLNGPMSQRVMVETSKILKPRIESSEENHAVRTKVFFVFVEQMQNIIRYSDEPSLEGDSARIGVIVMKRKAGRFVLSCGNRVTEEQAQYLREQLEQIKEMNAKDLKAHFKKVRKEDPPEGSKGAGLGLIDMARKSATPPEYFLDPLEDGKYFFEFTITI